jgi:hypothetical protein
MTKPLYIFDLDGTLALIQHRRHFVENRANRWTEFYKACIGDAPNKPIIEIFQTLVEYGAEVRIWSGRSDEVRAETIAWLNQHVFMGAFRPGCLPCDLTMRKAGNYTADDVLKATWFFSLPTEDKLRLVAIFDDRDRVVNMWRSLGITCLQVAPGEF